MIRDCVKIATPHRMLQIAPRMHCSEYTTPNTKHLQKALRMDPRVCGFCIAGGGRVETQKNPLGVNLGGLNVSLHAIPFHHTKSSKTDSKHHSTRRREQKPKRYLTRTIQEDNRACKSGGCSCKLILPYIPKSRVFALSDRTLSNPNKKPARIQNPFFRLDGPFGKFNP